MKLSFRDDRVLAIVAHPDDAELLCAGTLARAIGDGAAAAICCLCRGDKGQPEQQIGDLASVRRGEMSAAAGKLGAELYMGSIDDGTLQAEPTARDWLLEVVRQFRPTLMLAHSPNDYHSDHRAASALAETTGWFAASSGHASPSPVLPQPPSLWWMDTVNGSDFQPEFFVNVSDHVELKLSMLACHTSQLARGTDPGFSPLREMMLRQCRMRGWQAGVDAAEAFRAHRAWQRARAW